MGALAIGRTTVTGLLEAEDVLATAFGPARAGRRDSNGGGDGLWTITGVGIGGLVEPDTVLDPGQFGHGGDG